MTQEGGEICSSGVEKLKNFVSEVIFKQTLFVKIFLKRAHLDDGTESGWVLY
jgi:hypothetical protein